MKSVPLLLGFMIAFGFASTSPAQSTTNFCMDCTERLEESGDGTAKQIASCCTLTDDNHCYTNDWVKDLNVGYGCAVSAPDDRGWTSCQSSQVDKNCPQSGSGEKKSEATVQGAQGCVYDATGWCDIACRTCTWG